jgi:hypothetical protein
MQYYTVAAVDFGLVVLKEYESDLFLDFYLIHFWFHWPWLDTTE